MGPRSDRDGVRGSQPRLEVDGLHVSAETSRRMACDASTLVMRHAPDGRVLDVGRKTRTISPAIRRALTARDRHCQFSGCAARHCDAHHVRHWADGGTTRLDNLVLLCRHHHRAVHEKGFTLQVDTNGEARFFRPDGRLLPAVPPQPQWHGERLDEDWAISVLWEPRTQEQQPPNTSAETSRVH